MIAKFNSVCPACEARIYAGKSEISQKHQELVGVWTHVECESKVLAADYLAALKAVYAIPGGTALRQAATAMSVRVTRSTGRQRGFLDDSIIRVELARAGRTKFEELRAAADMAMASTRTTTTAKGEAATDVTPASDEDIDGMVAGARDEGQRFDLAAVAERFGNKLLDVARPEVVRAAEEAALAAVKHLVRVEHVVVAGGRSVTLEGVCHVQFEHLLQMVGAGLNVWMAGPLGSGKTMAAAQVAEGLALQFYFNGAIDTAYKLSGFVDAQGKISSTAFRQAYTDGGLYLFDEVDASMPSAVLAFNAALSGDMVDFPGESGPTRRHPDFRCVAAANTWGHGGDAQYVGRNKMDAAFLDRFVFLAWDYDEELELKLTAGSEDWTRKVQRLRASARTRSLKVVISPRAAINGARMMAAGFTEEQALEATVYLKMDRASVAALRGAAA